MAVAVISVLCWTYWHANRRHSHRESQRRTVTHGGDGAERLPEGRHRLVRAARKEKHLSNGLLCEIRLSYDPPKPLLPEHVDRLTFSTRHPGVPKFHEILVPCCCVFPPHSRPFQIQLFVKKYGRAGLLLVDYSSCGTCLCFRYIDCSVHFKVLCAHTTTNPESSRVESSRWRPSSAIHTHGAIKTVTFPSTAADRRPDPRFPSRSRPRLAEAHSAL